MWERKLVNKVWLTRVLNLTKQVNVEPVVYVLSPSAYTITQEMDEKRDWDKMSTTKKC